MTEERLRDDSTGGRTRRSVLYGAGATLFAGAGVAASSPTMAQLSGPDVDLVDLRGDGSPSLPSADELLVFVHGWFGTYAVEGQTEDLAASLSAGGYEADRNLAVRWDALTLNFPVAEARTEDVGATLAGVIEDYADATGGTVRLAGHSLGGRVVLETLDHLSAGYEVATVVPLGAAADGSTVTEGGRWYDGIAERAGEVRNYHSENDATVGAAYGGWADTALGTEGTPDWATAPENYLDVDVTADVESHTDYADNAAVGEDLAEAFLEDDDDSDEDDDDGDSDEDGGDSGGDYECSWCWWRWR